MSAESGEQCFPDFLFSGFCIAWKIKMKKNLFKIISILVCCTGVFAQKIPSWVEMPSKSFPEKTYITAVGEGRTKNQAEVNAIEKLAAVFGRDISSETKSTSRMVQARADGSVVTAEASGIERDVVQKVNAEDLVGVEIKDTCKDGKTYYAIAVMNRESARTAIISEINKNEPEIKKILAMKVSDKKSMENYSRLSLAHETAVYDEKLLKKSHTVMEVIENEEDFTPEYLTELEKKHKPGRIIIEYNGMWNIRSMKLPRSWRIEQQITTIDGSTFPMYYTNMRSQLAEMVKNSEMIIMNRCDGVQDLNTYKRNIKAVNPRADVIFEDANGEITDILEDDLPYDLSAEVLKLDDNGYGIWFLDIMDHPERYEGKTVEFLAMVLKPKDFPKNYFVPGRMAMTCCAEDISFLGYACEYEGADALKQKEWVKVKAVVHRKYWADYQGEGPVLTAVSVEKAKAPKKEVISFN